MQQIGPYSIRPMTPADIPTVATIDRLSFPTPWPTSSYVYELTRNSQSFYSVLLCPSQADALPPGHGLRVWFQGLLRGNNIARVIGYVGLRLETGGTHVSTLAVHPEWRGRGLGELLLLSAIEKTLELGLWNVTLEVRPSNHVARQLYVKYTFRFAGVHQGYYRDGEDAWLMEANLRGPEVEVRLARLRVALRARIEAQQAQFGHNGGHHV